MELVIEWLAIVLAAAFVIYLAVPGAIKLVLRRRFLARVHASGCACLTFDDGPNPESTPQILEILQRAGVRATFFMIGGHAERNPELTALVRRMGHEIGEHGYAHKNAWTSGPLASALDLWKCHKALAALGNGSRAPILRPPFGKLNLVTLIYAWIKKRWLAFWNVDPRDYASDSAEKVANYVADRMARGSVILLHDGRRAHGSDPAITTEALKMILERGSRYGVKFAPLGEALALNGNGNGNGNK